MDATFRFIKIAKEFAVFQTRFSLIPEIIGRFASFNSRSLDGNVEAHLSAVIKRGIVVHDG
jgi:hypothetical protein